MEGRKVFPQEIYNSLSVESQEVIKQMISHASCCQSPEEFQAFGESLLEVLLEHRQTL